MQNYLFMIQIGSYDSFTRTSRFFFPFPEQLENLSTVWCPSQKLLSFSPNDGVDCEANFPVFLGPFFLTLLFNFLRSFHILRLCDNKFVLSFSSVPMVYRWATRHFQNRPAFCFEFQVSELEFGD
mmetsp:Transcript_9248/g.19376  ORF Transcript_9248/g.19376 Transcript_9248/m.19376 type:complete len:125 (-) Transcript_9248:315-689(-)